MSESLFLPCVQAPPSFSVYNLVKGWGDVEWGMGQGGGMGAAKTLRKSWTLNFAIRVSVYA